MEEDGITVTVKELRKLYEGRKDDETVLELRGLAFMPRYLMYLLQHLDTLQVSEVTLTQPRRTE